MRTAVEAFIKHANKQFDLCQNISCCRFSITCKDQCACASVFQYMCNAPFKTVNIHSMSSSIAGACMIMFRYYLHV